VQTALVLVISYLLGSIPAGDIAGKLGGVDVRSVGSGNPGFTNVLRALGPRWAVPVLIVDIAKGALAVLFVAGVVGAGAAPGPTWTAILAGLAAVAGHNWPVFARFKGGRGVATACGVFAAMAPLATLAAALLWLALVLSTGYVSLGSIAAAALLPWAIWFEAKLLGQARPIELTVTAAAVALMVVVRHRANIGRLLNGTENRFGKRPEQGGRE
jgi:glycerol-3-phosphate acyltransferase PlsY